jgi:enoyl-CoA hydratase/carnithine racemase
MSGNAGIDRPPARVERPEPGVAVLFLDRPQQRNALSVAMMAALHGELATLGSDPAVAAIVIAAEGPGFCAGHDLKELTAHRDDPDGGRIFFTETMTRCAELMQAVVACPKPVIAAVHGIATAAGCQLVATCDLAVAEEDSRFATPGVNIGLFCSTPMVALARNVPRKRAMEMLLLGEMLGAAEAAEYGLVNRVVAKGEAYPAALDMARIIASKSPLTVAIGKKAFYDQIDMPLGQAYDFAAKVMVENMLKADAAEGIGAFLEKRDPVWKGC